MVEKIKTAVIDLGMMGFAQIKNCFLKAEEYEITAVCDNYQPHTDRAFEWLSQKGIKVNTYLDWRELLKNEKFDLAAIVTPDYLHEDIAVECLKAGKHLRIEKPMATTLEGCKRLIETWEKNPQIVQVGFELRNANLFGQMKERLYRAGKVRMIWCHEFRFPFALKTGSTPNWIVKKDCTGGTLLEKNCHHFDLFNIFAGAAPVSVYASGDNQTIYKETDVLDNAFVTVEYENHVRAMLSLCMFAPKKTRQPNLNELELGILGDQGRLEIKDDDLFFWDRGGQNEEHVSFLRDNKEAHADDILVSLKDLSDCIASGHHCETGLYAGLNSALVALTAEKSAAEHRIVTIKEMEQICGIPYYRQ
jgi:predicted dehydrogenase